MVCGTLFSGGLRISPLRASNTFDKQCCQGAEISAAKLKKGRKKFGAEPLPDLSKKGRKGAELFFGLVFHKIIYISCQKQSL
jgi:hypothetical protein